MISAHDGRHGFSFTDRTLNSLFVEDKTRCAAFPKVGGFSLPASRIESASLEK